MDEAYLFFPGHPIITAHCVTDTEWSQRTHKGRINQSSQSRTRVLKIPTTHSGVQSLHFVGFYHVIFSAAIQLVEFSIFAFRCISKLQVIAAVTGYNVQSRNVEIKHEDRSWVPVCVSGCLPHAFRPRHRNERPQAPCTLDATRHAMQKKGARSHFVACCIRCCSVACSVKSPVATIGVARPNLLCVASGVHGASYASLTGASGS